MDIVDDVHLEEEITLVFQCDTIVIGIIPLLGG